MCCGGQKNPIRTQSIPPKQSRKQIIQKNIKHDTNVAIQRQLLVKNDRCTKCGNMIMLVNIAGRERKQCVECKLVQR